MDNLAKYLNEGKMTGALIGIGTGLAKLGITIAGSLASIPGLGEIVSGDAAFGMQSAALFGSKQAISKGHNATVPSGYEATTKTANETSFTKRFTNFISTQKDAFDEKNNLEKAKAITKFLAKKFGAGSYQLYKGASQANMSQSEWGASKRKIVIISDKVVAEANRMLEEDFTFLFKLAWDNEEVNLNDGVSVSRRKQFFLKKKITVEETKEKLLKGISKVEKGINHWENKYGLNEEEKKEKKQKDQQREEQEKSSLLMSDIHFTKYMEGANTFESPEDLEQMSPHENPLFASDQNET